MTDTDAALVRHNGAPPAPASTSFVSQAPQQWQMAVQLADADIIPKDFRGKPANVFVALEMAHRLGIGPMEAMQNLYIVHGTPSMSAKFLIALANRSGRFRGGLRFAERGEGADLSVTCYATDRETGEELSVTVTMAQAKRAGWTKNGKYAEIPAQMLTYRAATFFVRRYCPEVSMGMVTVDEARELPREASAPSDPMDDVLTPIEPAPPEPAPTPLEAARAQATLYLPPDRAEKLVASFMEDKGLTYEEVLDRLGDPEKVTPETFQAMVAWYKELPDTPTPDDADAAPF